MKIFIIMLWTIMLPLGSYADVSFLFSARKTGSTTTSLRRLPADSIQYKIIKGRDNTYGYDIIQNGKLLIHQPHIPCIQGKKGFNKKKDAEKLALLVISKIRKGIMPPSVTEKELQDLGLEY